MLDDNAINIQADCFGLMARQRIVQLEAAMRMEIGSGALSDDTRTMPLQHYFIPGAYARELTIPAGTLIVGKIHREPCFNIVSRGEITVITEEGRKHIQAPAFFRSEPGVKRVGYAHADTVWTTIHTTDETDVHAIEDQLTCSSYEEFDRLGSVKETKCLGQQ